jgi:hypothetical protein
LKGDSIDAVTFLQGPEKGARTYGRAGQQEVSGSTLNTAEQLFSS